ncbi:hypothetical protein [Sodalis-like endosymbiont of Proechinophthirus fluctus]|uniref:hypothetical protein n=1 Tax=Sodalis-like endosymbiont of Proechinophthirus fluctus TaxID=1462730 RepID=UPI000AB448B5|nr:hypothetical protein [Sodalis-like endosymbiont of Proechinophthirus fluctus]
MPDRVHGSTCRSADKIGLSVTPGGASWNIYCSTLAYNASHAMVFWWVWFIPKVAMLSGKTASAIKKATAEKLRLINDDVQPHKNTVSNIHAKKQWRVAGKRLKASWLACAGQPAHCYCHCLAEWCNFTC